MKPAEMPPFQRSASGQTKLIFVNRLARLIQLRRELRDDLNPTGVELLDRAIYATYRDCIDFGAADQARGLMAGAGLEADGWGRRP